MRFPASKVGENFGAGTVIDLAGQPGEYDAGFVCRTFSWAELRGPEHADKDAHLVRVEPVVTKIKDYGSVIHHMDIFVCTEDVMDESASLGGNRRQESEWCSQDKFVDTSCRRLLWAYDRGAAVFDYPEEAGVLVGPSTGFTHAVLQLHYLLPETYRANRLADPAAHPPLVDSSGFELVLDTQLRPYDAGLFAFLDTTINVPVGARAFVFDNHADSVSLARLLAGDLLEYDEVHPFAVHLHAHNFARSVTLKHYRGDKELRKYGELKPFHG